MNHYDNVHPIFEEPLYSEGRYYSSPDASERPHSRVDEPLLRSYDIASAYIPIQDATAAHQSYQSSWDTRNSVPPPIQPSYHLFDPLQRQAITPSADHHWPDATLVHTSAYTWGSPAQSYPQDGTSIPRAYLPSYQAPESPVNSVARSVTRRREEESALVQPARDVIATEAVMYAAERRRVNPHKFFCQHCPSGFTARHNLSRHESAHHNVKPFTCECGSAFTTRADLKRHKDKSKKHSETPRAFS